MATLEALAATGSVKQRTFPHEANDAYVMAVVGGVQVAWGLAFQVGQWWRCEAAGRMPASHVVVPPQGQHRSSAQACCLCVC